VDDELSGGQSDPTIIFFNACFNQVVRPELAEHGAAALNDQVVSQAHTQVPAMGADHIRGIQVTAYLAKHLVNPVVNHQIAS
jgi:hypothetical protein